MAEPLEWRGAPQDLWTRRGDPEVELPPRKRLRDLLEALGWDVSELDSFVPSSPPAPASRESDPGPDYSLLMRGTGPTATFPTWENLEPQSEPRAAGSAAPRRPRDSANRE